MIAHRNIIKDIGRVLFWYPLRWCVNLMPFSTICWIGKVMGDADYILSGSKRIKRMARNVSQVFNDNEIGGRRIIKNNLENHCRNILELIKYPQFNQRNIANYLSIENIALLNRELAEGKGVMLFTAHFGAKQLLQVAFGLKGYKINQICYHMGQNKLTFIQKHVSQRQRRRIEEKIPAKFIPVDGFLRSAFNCLRKNEILIIAADGVGLPEHMNKGYTPFLFLGKKVLFPSNIISLAKRTGASVLPIFVIRDRIKHKIVIEPAIEINSKSNEDAFEEFVKILEKYIRQYPSLWEFWEEFEEGVLIVPDK
jgi:KDO2-lipid IV(A) lauroyltransferase